MPFNKNDIYTSSGSVKLYNSWTPYVSKYDTSSFYNWEQDNLPLHDLEERTYLLWEQGGFATSSVPGLALTVSADAANTPEGQAALLSNKNLFTSVSSCIAALPKVIRFPVLIEVASFGNMGPLELNNYKIEDNGSIEIINRNFSRILSASSVVNQVVTAPSVNSSHTIIRLVSSIDVSSTLSNASCLNINTSILSSTTDTRISESVGNIVTYPVHTVRKAPLGVAFSRPLPLPTNRFGTANIYESQATGSNADLTQASYDISAFNEYQEAINDPVPLHRDDIVVNDMCTGNIYFNRLTKIVVRNCVGPIYIRNFFVNNNNVEEVGIDIQNSTVVLENCSTIRNKNAGFNFNNSKVILSRSAYSARNYDISSTGSRVPDKGTGFNVFNSEVILSSLPISVTGTSVGDAGASGLDFAIVASRNNKGFSLNNSKLIGGQSRLSYLNPSSQSVLASELNTNIGIELFNSYVDVSGLIDLYQNQVGIDSNLSKIIFQEMVADNHQKQAIKTTNSTVIWNSSYNPGINQASNKYQLDFSSNGQHLKLNNNSYFSFERKNNIPFNYGNTKFVEDHGYTRIAGNTSSTTVGVKLPSISVDSGSNLDLLHVKGWANIHPANAGINGRFLSVTNNSNASLFGTASGATFIAGSEDWALQFYVAGIGAKNNSTINIHGPTVIGQFGIDILAEDGSIININPPKTKDLVEYDVSGFNLTEKANHTHVELHSTRSCLVANKNSIINLTDLGDYRKNWPRGVIGSTFDLGDADYRLSTDVSALLDSGSLQFYPNPSMNLAYPQARASNLGSGPGTPSEPFAIFTTTDLQVYNFIVQDGIVGLTPNYTNRAYNTQGGVCVRAIQNSNVNVKNVHFPLGTNSSNLDGIYYNASGSACDKLMIWNIADTSKLNASYLSVSGLHPADTIYHGPSAFWVSSNGGTGYRIASGAPISTPDTGRLSVLDFFGAGSAVWQIPSGVSFNSPFNRFHLVTGSETTEQKNRIYGGGMNNGMNKVFRYGENNTFNNKGIFRIYWSPKSSAKILANDLSGYTNGAFPHGGNFSGVIGPAYQVFAQGYNCSAPLSALIPPGRTEVSSIYPDLLKIVDTNNNNLGDNIWTSGFYYCSEMMHSDPLQCVLEESAANTFANAKNASLGFSGTPKKVTIHNAEGYLNSNRFTESYGGDLSGSVGFKSASIFDLSRDN